MMYAWFNEHLELGADREPVEAPIVPLTRAELSVFDAEHPRPADEGGAEAVRAWWRARVERRSRPGASMTGMSDGILSPLRVLVRAERPHARTEGIAVFVTGPDGDPEYERVVARLEELSPFEVRRISPPEKPAPRDERRHATYAGYSWCYNPPDVVLRARRIAAEVASWNHARLLAVGPEARAAALAIPGQFFLGGKLQRAALASGDWHEPRTDLDDRDFLPCERGLGGMVALLTSTFAGDPVRPRIALVGAGAVPASLRVLDGRDRPEELGAPHDLDHARGEDFVVRRADLDDAVLRWLVEP
jgi:hypothetical protein